MQWPQDTAHASVTSCLRNMEVLRTSNSESVEGYDEYALLESILACY
jgi:hypothetical protein